MKETTYLIHQGNLEDYRVINQTGVRQAIVHEPLHNACWDANLAPDGTLYFSVCSELTTHEYAKLYKYDYDTNTASECFYTKDYLLKSDRYIRDSKFHTSIHFKPDGKLIMVTHTTDKSPCHPAWLPMSFVSNVWEGFPGGELMEYDPKTGKVDLLGIPAPRESIYGAVYSPKDDAYYMMGWMRGHLYRYDCKTRKCEDKGQATDYRCYRIVLGPDQNLYFSTKSGFMMRYNVDTQQIEDLNARIPCDKTEKGDNWPYTYLGPCPIGPDGRLYITGNYTDILSALDVKTGEIEVIGKMVPADEYVDNDEQHVLIPGMAFDRDGVLWYATMSFRNNEDEYYKVPSVLFRWDFLHGGKPEPLGLFGTPGRVQTFSDSFFVDKERDILFSVSTNHSYGSPDVIAIDLKQFREVMYEKGPVCEDRLMYAPGDEEFKEFGDGWHNTKAAIRKYAANVKADHIDPVRLWREFGPTGMAESAVKGLRWMDNDTLEGICGKEKLYRFVIQNGRLAEMKETDEATAAAIIPARAAEVEGLPFYPGRQWRANALAECPWLNGQKLVGTEDGFLAKVNPDGSVTSIGPAVCQGPIRCLTSSLETGVAYGVGGDVEDVGNVFRYTEKEGLQYLGFMSCDVANNDVGTCVNFILSSCVLSPDGKKLAVGACDRMSSVYICENPHA